LLWQFLPSLGLISEYVLPPFLDVIKSFPQLFDPNNPLVPGGFMNHFYLTLFEIGSAFSLAVAIGLPLGFAIGYYRTLAEAYEPLLYILYSIPAPLLYPVIYLLFGLGFQSKIVLGFILAVFPLIINTIAGFRSLENIYLTVAIAFGANGSQIFKKIILPGIAPFIVSGLRLALASTFVGIIFGQIIASSDGGLGWIITFTAENFVLTQTYGTIIIILIVVYAILQVFEYIERRVFKYYVER
jgi:NitT/TauT family transport system permease protein